MKINYSLKIRDYESKNKIVTALTDNGYIVRATQVKGEKLIGFDHWKIDVIEENQIKDEERMLVIKLALNETMFSTEQAGKAIGDALKNVYSRVNVGL